MKIYTLSFALICCFISFSSFHYFSSIEHLTTSNELDRGNFYYVLDNGFQGGSDAFIDIFESELKYPEKAIQNCRVGVSQITFKIDREGTFSNLNIQNPLEFGIEKEIERFFESIKSKWKTGRRVHEMSMTIGFQISTEGNRYSPDADLIVSHKPAFRYSTGDISCEGDEFHEKKMQKYIKKKKFIKAQPHVDELLRRYPGNDLYLKNKQLLKENVDK